MYHRYQYLSDPLLTEANLSPLLTGKSLTEQLDETCDSKLFSEENLHFGSPQLSDLSTCCLTDQENATIDDGNDKDLIGSDSDDWELSNQSWMSNRILESNQQASTTNSLSYPDENVPAESWRLCSPNDLHLRQQQQQQQQQHHHYLLHHNPHHQESYEDNCPSSIEPNPNLYSFKSVKQNPIHQPSIRHPRRSRTQKHNSNSGTRSKPTRLRLKYPAHSNSPSEAPSSLLTTEILANPVDAPGLTYPACLRSLPSNDFPSPDSYLTSTNNSCPKLRSTRQRRCPARYWQSDDAYLGSNTRQPTMRNNQTKRYVQQSKAFFAKKAQTFHHTNVIRLSRRSDKTNPHLIAWPAEFSTPNFMTQDGSLIPSTHHYPWSVSDLSHPHLPGKPSLTVTQSPSSSILDPCMHLDSPLLNDPHWSTHPIDDSNNLKSSFTNYTARSTLSDSPSLYDHTYYSPLSSSSELDTFHVFDSDTAYLANEASYSPLHCYGLYPLGLDLQSASVGLGTTPSTSTGVQATTGGATTVVTTATSTSTSTAVTTPSAATANVRNPVGRGRKRHLLQFIVELLMRGHNCVEWVSEVDRVFHIINPDQLTRLWGKYKNNTGMTFDSLSRSLRLYYAPGKLERIQGRRHQYRILALDSDDL